MPNIVDRIEVRSGMMYIQRPGYYFGYGLEADPEVMEAIVGHSINTELGVTAVKKQLVIQEIDQIPDLPAEAFGWRSPRQIIAATWEKHTEAPFSSYAVRDSENRSDAVKGTLYEIDMDDALRLNEWDLSTPFVRDASGKIAWPGWRYWDHTVELADGRNVSTLTIYPEQQSDRAVDGMNYERFLNDKALTMQVIAEVTGGLR